MDARSPIWKPLDPARREIRLFVLSPDKEETAPPTGRLEIVTLSDHALSYDAISHAWGNPTYPEPLYLEGVYRPVTASLFEALKRVRHKTYPVRVWIDALCINQFDDQERSSQVELMQHIFRQASTVYIWLGWESEVVENLVKAIRNAPSQIQVVDRAQSDGDLRHATSMVAFARLDYFQRLWVIQEIALARNLQFVYGDQTFTMEKLEHLYQYLETEQRQGRGATEYVYVHDRLRPVLEAPDLLKIATSVPIETKAEKLVRVMQRSRIARCSDPKDRIYGLSGVMTAMFGEDFMRVDYRRTLMEVYTYFAGRLISVTGSLALLNQTESFYNSNISLPSWVPDWTSNFYHRDAIRRVSYHRKFHSSGENIKDELRPSYAEDFTSVPFVSGRLKVRGFVFDVVREIGGIARSCSERNVNRQGIKETLVRWRQQYQGSKSSFSRTITLDLRKHPPTLDECFQVLETGPKRRTESQHENRSAMLAAIGGRCFFITETGKPGLGPMDTQIGDLLAILAGGKVPYVLRQKPNTPRQGPLSFVGESYVHEVMYGEVLKEPEFSWQEIVLE